MTIHVTEVAHPEQPALEVWDDEGSGTRWLVGKARPHMPVCTCPAGIRNQSCKHERAAMQWWLDHKTKEGPVSAEEERGLVPHQPQGAALVRASAAERSAMVREQVLAFNESWAVLVENARGLIASKAVPWRTPEQGAIVLLKAAELGVPLGQASDYIDIIESKKDGKVVAARPRLRGRMVAALVQRHCAANGRDGIDGIFITHQSPTSVTGYARRGRYETTPLTLTRDMFGHIQRDVWARYSMDMLVAKVQSRLGHQMFADVLGGMEVGAGIGGTEVQAVLDELPPDVVEGEVVEVIDEATGEMDPPPAGAEPEIPQDAAETTRETPEAPEEVADPPNGDSGGQAALPGQGRSLADRLGGGAAADQEQQAFTGKDFNELRSRLKAEHDLAPGMLVAIEGWPWDTERGVPKAVNRATCEEWVRARSTAMSGVEDLLAAVGRIPRQEDEEEAS